MLKWGIRPACEPESRIIKVGVGGHFSVPLKLGDAVRLCDRAGLCAGLNVHLNVLLPRWCRGLCYRGGVR